MQSATCNLQHAMCSTRNVQHAQCATCAMCSTRNVQHATCNACYQDAFMWWLRLDGAVFGFSCGYGGCGATNTASGELAQPTPRLLKFRVGQLRVISKVATQSPKIARSSFPKPFRIMRRSATNSGKALANTMFSTTS